MIGITENPYVYSNFESIFLNFIQSLEPSAVPPIVQYHTKGEFQPVVPTFSITEPEETTDSEIFHPTAEEPLHETSEVAKEVEEAYVPTVEPIEPIIESERIVSYNAWDASRLVTAMI